MENILRHLQIGQKKWIRSADPLQRLNFQRIVARQHSIRSRIVPHPQQLNNQRNLDIKCTILVRVKQLAAMTYSPLIFYLSLNLAHYRFL